MGWGGPPIQTGVDHVHAHPRHVGHRSLDLILALTAVFISAVSLYEAVEHGRTERELVQANAQLVQANSWPFLELNASYSDDGPTEISIANAGIGPAKLQTIEVLFDGKSVSDLYALLELCCDLPRDRAKRRAELPQGLRIDTLDHEVMRPGQSSQLVSLPAKTADIRPDNGPSLSTRFAVVSHRISYRACYCSVFDKCWITDLVSLQPRSVDQCPVEARGFNTSLQ